MERQRLFAADELGDVHELTLEPEPAWRRVDPAGAAPCARDGHSAVLSDDGRSILVFGGFDGKRHLNDAFALDVVGADGGAAYAWRPLRPRGPKPAARYLHAAQACEGGMLVFRGVEVLHTGFFKGFSEGSGVDASKASKVVWYNVPVL